MSFPLGLCSGRVGHGSSHARCRAAAGGGAGTGGFRGEVVAGADAGGVNVSFDVGIEDLVGVELGAVAGHQVQLDAVALAASQVVTALIDRSLLRINCERNANVNQPTRGFGSHGNIGHCYALRLCGGS